MKNQTVPVGVVVAALQQQAVGKPVPKLQIDAHGGDGVGEQVLICGFQLVHYSDFSA